MLDEALTLRGDPPPHDHTTQTTVLLTSVTLQKLERLSEAECMAREAVEIARAPRIPSWSVPEAQALLARVQLDRSLFVEAESTCRAALDELAGAGGHARGFDAELEGALGR